VSTEAGELQTGNRPKKRQTADQDLLRAREVLPAGVTAAVNGVLFAVIGISSVAGFSCSPFLIIGIVSAVREILTVGAKLSLQGEGAPAVRDVELHRLLLELGVNAAVVLGLSAALGHDPPLGRTQRRLSADGRE